MADFRRCRRRGRQGRVSSSSSSAIVVPFLLLPLLLLPTLLSIAASDSSAAASGKDPSSSLLRRRHALVNSDRGDRRVNRVSPPPLQPKIVGGTDALQNNSGEDDRTHHPYPYFAALRGCHWDAALSAWDCCGGTGKKKDRDCWGGCGGALISSRHVLTAAHCVAGNEDSFRTTGFAVGTVCRSEDNCDRTVHRSAVTSVSVHPRYGIVEGGVVPQFDVALVELEEEATFTDPVDVDVHVKESVVSGPANRDAPLIVVGLGRDVPESSGSGINSKDFPRHLQEAHLLPVSDDDCAGMYRNNFDRDSMMCAGTGKDGPDTATCQGDSGGPLLSSQKAHKDGGGEGDRRPVLVGISSWGTTLCDGAYPGVFAHVGTAAEWFGPVVCNYYPSYVGADDADAGTKKGESGSGDSRGGRPNWCRVCDDQVDNDGAGGGERPIWCDSVAPAVRSSNETTESKAATDPAKKGKGKPRKGQKEHHGKG